MLVIATQRSEDPQTDSLINAMHRLRARTFAGRLGWKVNVENEQEADEFDCFSPTYILAVSAEGAVAGCARLLPTTGPTMLEHVFPQLLTSGKLETHPGMIESSRFCVDTTIGESRGRNGLLHTTTLSMFAGIIEWAMTHGYSEIVTATDLRFERILARAGWPMRRLGEPRRIGNTEAVAGSLQADSACFARVRPPNYRFRIDTASVRAA